MRNNSWLLDTNIILYLLKGNPYIQQIIDGHQLYLSFVSEIELLSFPKLSPEEENVIFNFFKYCTIIDYSAVLKPKVIHVVKNHHLKLPDALIAATSLHFSLPLLTADLIFERLDDPLIYIYRPLKSEE